MAATCTYLFSELYCIQKFGFAAITLFVIVKQTYKASDNQVFCGY